MATTIGSPVVVSLAATQVQVQSPAATAGTAPYIYQWYRATSGPTFTPGSGNLIGSAQSPSGSAQPAVFTDPTVLTPTTTYYYRVIATDNSGTPVAATSAGVQAVTTVPILSQNQFALQPFLGVPDLRYNYNTIAVQFDPAGSGTLTSGQAVKISTNTGSGTVPLVVQSTATSDVVLGFVNFSIKDINYVPGQMLEISMSGNVMYLYAALAISAGNFLTSLPSAVAGGCVGGVVPVTGSSGFPIIGWALNKAAIGQLVRVQLSTPAAAYAID